MDLEHILGTVMILWVVISCIGDKRKCRTFDNPETEPVKSPPPSDHRTRRAGMLARKRIELMKERKLGHLLMTDFRFSDRITQEDMASPESIREKLNLMLHEMMRHLKLPPVYTVEVIPDEDRSIAPDRTAECSYRDRQIRFFLRRVLTPEQLTTLLCHECAHYFCLYYRMYEYKLTMLNEHYTDVTACLMGFSKYMLIPGSLNYLSPAEMKAVRWTLLEERKAQSGSDAA